MTELMPWCPACGQRVTVQANVTVNDGRMGVYMTFDAHGCEKDGQKVMDADYGFVTDNGTVPKWEFFGEAAPAPPA